MSIYRFSRLYHLYTKRKDILIRSSIRVCFFFFLTGISSITYAQTVGGVNSSDDFDGDGIINSIDLDDDNDGVLDSHESICAASLMNKTGITVTSPVTWTYYNGATSLQGLVDGLDGMNFSASTAATFTNQTILEFDLPVATILTEIELGNYPSQTALLPGGTYKMQGWNGTQWDDIGVQQVIATSTPINATVTNNSIKFYMENNFLAYTKYRIYGISASGSQSANELYFTQSECTDIDTDGDGKPNRLDLDSDGDGCADAVEANSSKTATSTTVCPTGTDANRNGLNDNYELSNLSGSYNYTSKYSDYALNNFINLCTDTDLDGSPDFIDIDDDNDGILDINEITFCNTITTPTAATGTANWSGSPPSLTIDNSGMSSTGLSAVTAGSSLLADSYFMSEPYTKGFLEYTLPANTSLGGVVLWAPDANNYGGGDGPVKDFRVEVIYNNVVTYTSQTFTTAQPIGDGANRGAQVFYLGKTFANPQKVRLNILSGWYDINNNSSIQVGTETIPMGTINVAYNMTLSEFKVICGPVDLDTDGDGKPNRLDLDSDGDGCADAIEAGTAPIGTIAATATSFLNPATTGVNGFANSLETNSESGIYKGTYSYDYAVNASFSTCLDADGDGIINTIDLDDDNDGILDAIESPTCFYTAIELGKPIAVSSDLAAYSTYVITNSIDNSPSSLSAFAASVNWVNKEIFNFTAVDFIGITGISFDLVNWSLSASASMTFKLQGSSNNSTWTDLSPAVSSIATTGTFTISNTLARTSKFKYYRILGVAGTSNYGGVYNATFNLATNTIPSGSPKATCSNDTDVDGIVNHLDLDSDGDGCADAIEAGTAPRGTTANSATSFLNPTTTGANGFANSLETATDSGIYTGTYTYQFALFSSTNVCLDTDGDGVADLVDLDDDNDGVLDASELSCSAVAINTACLAAPQNFGIITHCSGWDGFDYDPSPSVTVVTNFDYMGLSNGFPYFDLQGSSASSATSVLVGKMYKNYSTVPGMTYTFSINLISAFVDVEGMKHYLKGVDATTGLELGATSLNG